MVYDHFDIHNNSLDDHFRDSCTPVLLLKFTLYIILGLLQNYSWIGRPVRTHRKSICRETERATTDLNIGMKSSRRDASNGGVQQFMFSFLESYS